MNDLEDRLRDAFAAAAGTVRPQALRPLPERTPRRRVRVLVPLAAAVSVAAVIAVIALTVPLVFSGSHRPGEGPAVGSSPRPSSAPSRPAPSASAAPTGPPAGSPLPGAPRFIAGLPVSSGTTDGPLQIQDAATGKVVARDVHVTGTALAALPGGRTFLIARPATGNTCGTRFYRFGLSAGGDPGPLVPLPILAVHGDVVSMAPSADGHTLAYAAQGCAKGTRTYVGVANVVTGQVRQWSSGTTGQPQASEFVGEVSLTPDGRLLAYETTTTSAASTTVWILPTNAPAGTAAQRSRVAARFPDSPRSAFGSAVIGSAGRTLDVCTTVGGKLPFLELASYDVATGQRLRVLATLPRQGNSGCVVSRDPSGRFLLVPYSVRHTGPGSGTRAVFGAAEVAVATGKVARITVTTPSGAMSSIVGAMLFAW